MGNIGKAVWIHNLPQEGPEDVRMVARRLAEAGISLLIPCIKNVDGFIDYHGAASHIRPEFNAWDPLQVLTEEARRVGLSIHPWCCVFPEGEGSRLLQEHPEYVALDPAGAPIIVGNYKIRWACCARPEVQDYELAMYYELMDRYDIDGVHLDYIRYHQGLRGQRSCYCAYCRAAFKQETGFEPSFDEATRAWSAWVDWKAARITLFVQQLSIAAKTRSKEVSAAVFPDYPDSIPDIGQDWEDWGRRRLVDYMFPMNYTMNNTIAVKRTRNHVAGMSGSGVPLWEGLWNRPEVTTPMLMEQVRCVLAAGAQGIVIFEYYSLDDQDLRALSKL
jgi:uncharacterized lipoprotein YddW (UPF0748 family)